ncbi:hypothetical protein TNCV_281791 [Trichonephila clavipes]|nr:hypothetical protein TNCV_281791 [Trichonephila clavipes]
MFIDASSAKRNGINVLFEFFETIFYFLNVIEPNVHNNFFESESIQCMQCPVPCSNLIQLNMCRICSGDKLQPSTPIKLRSRTKKSYPKFFELFESTAYSHSHSPYEQLLCGIRSYQR